MTPADSPSTPPRANDFADVTDMFRTLRTLPIDSPEYARQRDRIITRCLPLADRIAKRFARRGEPFDDLQQIARMGLLLSINRFDPDNGADFLAYAIPTMMGEVRRYFRDHTWAMRVPRRLKDLHVRIGAVTPRLTQSLGRTPTATDLAAALDVSREEVVECLVAANAYSLRSIDAPLSDHDKARPALTDTLGAQDAQLDTITDRESLRPLLATLSERESAVLNLRFFAGMTQSQIADQMGMSQMHVSRILAKTLRRLREGVLDERSGRVHIHPADRSRTTRSQESAAARGSRGVHAAEHFGAGSHGGTAQHLAHSGEQL